MTRGRRFWLIVIIVVLVVGSGGYAYYRRTTTAAAQDNGEPAVQTAVARRGDITVSATGAGTIIPAQEVELSFAAAGKLKELLVKVGDQVAAGDVLARLDDTDTQQALAGAQLQSAQASMQTDATATETGISYDEISAEQARINLELAQTALDDLLNWKPDADAVVLAKANLAAAQASYHAALGNEAASGSSIQVLAINLEQAQRDLADAQAAYDTAFDPGREWEFGVKRLADALTAERDGATRSLQRAQDSLKIAQANYNAAISSSNHSSSTNAESGLLSAQQALTTTLTGPTDEEIKAAELAVRQADLSLQQALLNQEANSLSLRQAELNVEAAQATVDGMVLTAPMDGTVTAVNFSVGETVNGSVIVLADLAQPMLELYLDETDMNMVGVGYEVDVAFDALPDDTFIGHVIEVDPQLSNVNNVTAVRAVAQLDEESFAKPQTLPIGLNATVEVIGGRTTNAVLVPVEALREISPGKYAVFVMENGEPKLRFVEVGLMDFTYAEITSGLEAGEVVTTGIVETQ